MRKEKREVLGIVGERKLKVVDIDILLAAEVFVSEFPVLPLARGGAGDGGATPSTALRGPTTVLTTM